MRVFIQFKPTTDHNHQNLSTSIKATFYAILLNSMQIMGEMLLFINKIHHNN